MAKPNVPVIHRTLFSWVFTPGNLKLQILLIVIILVAVAARVVPLEMQKRIVNEAITMGQMELLIKYCGIYIASVILASGLKFAINTIQTFIGQRTLAAMRRELYRHILTLPLHFFRKSQPGMVVSSLVTELASAGDFVGMALAAPAASLLTLAAFAAYLFWLNPLLAAVSLALYPLVMLILPRLQRRVNRANKQRVDITRSLSSKIGESITGIQEIHGNGSFAAENRKFDGIVESLLKIRIIWNLYKFGVKVTNNFFNNLGPFFIFLLGGYLVIHGRLELGALVAFLSAQEKLYDPWKELIDFYQAYQDATVSYRRTMEYFDEMPNHPLVPEDRAPYELTGEIRVKDVSFLVDGDIRLLENISLDLEAGEHMALVGFSGSGKSTLVQCIGQLYDHTTGTVEIDGKEVAAFTKADVARNIGIVSQSPFIFDGTIEENLLYAYLSARDGDGAEPASLDDEIEAIQQAGLFVDVLRFGLNAVLEKEQHAGLVEQILRIRENFRQTFADSLSDDVEFFSPKAYLQYSSVAENITMGAPNRDDFAHEHLCGNRYFRRFLDKADLTRPLLSLGADIARQVVDILGNLEPDPSLFERSPIQPDELPDYKELTEQLKRQKLHQLSPADQEMLLRAALRFAPGLHPIVSMPPLLENLILEGRALFMDRIAEDDPDAVTFYEMRHYIHSQTLLNNILFGKLKTDRPQTIEKINQAIIQLLVEEDLMETVVRIGLQYQVGNKGENLSGGQRQKLAIARVLLKKPPVLLMDEATSGLDNSSQARIQHLLESRWKGTTTLISVVHRLDIIKNYDKIAVMKAGKIVEMGAYDDLMGRKGVLYELVGNA